MSLERTQPKILIVEDNPLDIYLLCDALKAAGFQAEPRVVHDGAVALELLKNQGEFQDEPTPDLLILDLNLRLVDGPEVLQYVRENHHLRNMKVIILSSSPTDLMRSKAANADAYFTKPSALEAFMELGNKISDCYYRVT